ncbi:MAG: hypothetical protein RL648_926 [Verrucomicrobiota bacterium]
MMKALNRLLLIALGLFFFTTGSMKLLDPAAFAEAILGYRIIDGFWAMLFALWIPWAECLLAVALAWRSWREQALIVLLGLMIGFQGALASAYLRGLDISCGCFGADVSSSVGFALVRNCALMALIAYVFRAERRERTIAGEEESTGPQP